MACKHEYISLQKSHSYPGPLILPGDALEDLEGGQSLEEFLEEERHEVTPERKIIYIVPPPEIDKSVNHVKKWKTTTDFYHRVAEYVEAFFGLAVKVHDGVKLTKGTGTNLDMLFDDQILDIRTREDKTFTRQLNLNDLLDVLINMLPDDAFAIMMLVDHDIYEDEDEFCCGRAYGLSRVAVVSTARYNPGLDEKIGLDREHAWPASHCSKYIESLGKKARRGKRKGSAMKSAVDAFSESSNSDLHRLWLSRVCKTVCHELGHCFGIDHCEEYACLMQGTAGLLEDARQPPYFCPVDQKKLKIAGCDQTKLLELLRKEYWRDEPVFKSFERWLSEIRGQ